jgi:glycine cleavage system H lipoate-binding protein
MSWFSSKNNDKPEVGEVYYTKLPKEGKKLNSYDGDETGTKKHPVIVVQPNDDDTTGVVGCTTKQKTELGDIEVVTEPPMSRPTYARVYDKERDIKTSELTRDGQDRVCKNIDEIKRKL